MTIGLRRGQGYGGGEGAGGNGRSLIHSERAEAGATIQTAIEERGEPLPPDPYRSYHSGDRAEQRRLLEKVKAMVRSSPR